MKNIDVILGTIAIFLVMAAVGTGELEAQERADAYEQEARADARVAAIQLARELRMRGALDDGLLVRPVAKLGE